jgi:hypothetical protein
MALKCEHHGSPRIKLDESRGDSTIIWGSEAIAQRAAAARTTEFVDAQGQQKSGHAGGPPPPVVEKST